MKFFLQFLTLTFISIVALQSPKVETCAESGADSLSHFDNPVQRFLSRQAVSRLPDFKSSSERDNDMRSLRLLASMAATIALTSSLVLVISTTASAAESIPPLQYPAPTLGQYSSVVSGTSGSTTLPCNTMGTGVDLITYNGSGALTRQLDRTQVVDGVPNCITLPVVDKNDNLYGVPYGKNSSGSWVFGPNLLAYSGNTLKWKYPLACGSSGPHYAMGATGNIYATANLSDGLHLIGLTPEVAAGQSQPTKVLDVKLYNDCSTDVFPYRDGVMLRGQNSGIRYYSYTGQLISQPSANRLMDAKINAMGHLFDYKLVSGSFTSATITKIDPAANAPLWSTSASTSGSNAQFAQLYPLSNGGVVAVVREQKMASPGVPATPTVYVSTLVTLDAAGQRIGATTLERSNSQGTFPLGAFYAAPTSDGRLAFVQDFQLNTGLSNPSTIPALAVGVYNPATISWDYQQILTGDLNKSGGPSGYAMEFGAQDSAVAPTANTLSFLGRCSGNCAYIGGSVIRKLYSLAIPGLGGNYPRGVVTTTTPRQGSPYVAVGDSFSAGEGITPFEAGTDSLGVNMCHRSSLAYPRLIAGTSTKIPSLGTTGFRACSGAVTLNIGDGAPWNEGIQLDWWPDPTIQVVTVTIGGNDIKFGDFASACVVDLASCGIGSAPYNNSLNKINNELAEKLTATYRKILQYAPNAKIYVAGYPQVMANKAPNDPFDGRCAYMYDINDNTDHWKDVRGARDIMTKLDQKVSDSVATVRAENYGNTRLNYVQIDGPLSPFVGHEVCGTSASWFLNVDQAINNPAYVFHPNASGQQGYASLMAAQINAG